MRFGSGTARGPRHVLDPVYKANRRLICCKNLYVGMICGRFPNLMQVVLNSELVLKRATAQRAESHAMIDCSTVVLRSVAYWVGSKGCKIGYAP
jgi:hypothetical protein